MSNYVSGLEQLAPGGVADIAVPLKLDLDYLKIAVENDIVHHTTAATDAAIDASKHDSDSPVHGGYIRKREQCVKLIERAKAQLDVIDSLIAQRGG